MSDNIDEYNKQVDKDNEEIDRSNEWTDKHNMAVNILLSFAFILGMFFGGLLIWLY